MDLFAIVIARYNVAFLMLVYGFGKIFDVQFCSGGSYCNMEQKIGNIFSMGLVFDAYEYFKKLCVYFGIIGMYWRHTIVLEKDIYTWCNYYFGRHVQCDAIEL